MDVVEVVAEGDEEGCGGDDEDEDNNDDSDNDDDDDVDGFVGGEAVGEGSGDAADEGLGMIIVRTFWANAFVYCSITLVINSTSRVSSEWDDDCHRSDTTTDRAERT